MKRRNDVKLLKQAIREGIKTVAELANYLRQQPALG